MKKNKIEKKKSVKKKCNFKCNKTTVFDYFSDDHISLCY